MNLSNNPILKLKSDLAFADDNFEDSTEHQFYDEHDSALFYWGVLKTLKKLGSQDITLIDLCGHSGIIASQLFREELISKFWVLDLYPKVMIDFSKKIEEILTRFPSDLNKYNEAAKLHLQPFNILNNSDKHHLANKINQTRNNIVVVSANPPWEPAPRVLDKLLKSKIVEEFFRHLQKGTTKEYVQNLRRNKKHLKKLQHFCDKWSLNLETLPLICGGTNGLRFHNSVFQFSELVNANKICINTPSISNINTLENLLTKHNLVIEAVQLFDYITYGFDASTIAQDHYTKKIPNNFFRYNSKGLIQYLLMNIRMGKKEHPQETDINLKKLQHLLELYKSHTDNSQISDFMQFVEQHSDIFTLWKRE